MHFAAFESLIWMQIFQAGSSLPSPKLQTHESCAASPAPADARRGRSGLFKGIPSVRIILPLCLLPIQVFCEMPREIERHLKQDED